MILLPRGRYYIGSPDQIFSPDTIDNFMASYRRGAARYRGHPYFITSIPGGHLAVIPIEAVPVAHNQGVNTLDSDKELVVHAIPGGVRAGRILIEAVPDAKTFEVEVGAVMLEAAAHRNQIEAMVMLTVNQKPVEARYWFEADVTFDRWDDPEWVVGDEDVEVDEGDDLTVAEFADVWRVAHEEARAKAVGVVLSRANDLFCDYMEHRRELEPIERAEDAADMLSGGRV